MRLVWGWCGQHGLVRVHAAKAKVEVLEKTDTDYATYDTYDTNYLFAYCCFAATYVHRTVRTRPQYEGPAAAKQQKLALYRSTPFFTPA